MNNDKWKNEHRRLSSYMHINKWINHIYIINNQIETPKNLFYYLPGLLNHMNWDFVLSWNNKLVKL